MRAAGRVGRWATAAWLAAAALCAAGPAGGQTPEDAVKATYLYKLIPFIGWDGRAFPSPSTPLAICVQGVDPFGGLLDRAVAGQRAQGRPLTVRRVAVVGHGSGCHLLYVAGSSEQAADEALKAVRGEPVVTITDAARAPSSPGMIHFVRRGERIGFQINGSAANAEGIQISSKLQALALGSGR